MQNYLYIFFLFTYFIGLPNIGTAQNIDNDKLRNLPEISITAEKLQNFSTGINVQTIDSIAFKQIKNQNLDEILRNQSSIFIKNYGPGGLSSISLRGTSDTHTGIFWNGTKLNSPNIGTLDLSLIPIDFFNSIQIQHGGSSSLYGSGIVGGSLHLNNTEDFKLNQSLLFNASILSYYDFVNNANDSKKIIDQTSYFLKFNKSTKKLNYKLGVLYSKADNCFKYKNIAKFKEPIEYQINAEQLKTSVIQDICYKNKNGDLLSNLFWFSYSDRNLPPTMTTALSNENQIDRSFRTIFNYEKKLQKIKLNFKSSYYNDYLKYSNDKLGIVSNIKTQTITAEINSKYEILKEIKVFKGISFTLNQADIKAYNSTKYFYQSALFLSFLYKIPILDWSANLNFREDYYRTNQLFFSPSLGFEGKIYKKLNGRIYISKNHRIPTMNDKYWIPGGNDSLKTEKSNDYELGLNYRLTKLNSLYSDISITYYNSYIYNWIQWQPTKFAYFAPTNIKTVNSKGFELDYRFKFIITKNITICFSESYSYTSSINKELNINDSTQLNKQLIYVPKNKNSSNCSFYLNNFDININYLFTDKLYYTTDNSKFIKQSNLFNTTIGYSFIFKNSKNRLSFTIYNLLNTDYQIIEYRPMPKRYFKISIECIIN